jgi:hypothetical protein
MNVKTIAQLKREELILTYSACGDCYEERREDLYLYSEKVNAMTDSEVEEHYAEVYPED